jgi:predicted lactoylglutathione lyase
MANQIFVNLPVKDLKRSIDFFTKLGYAFEPKFTDDKATCMIVSDNIFVMLLVDRFFKTFTPKEICDAHKQTETLICLRLESRQKVDELVARALAAGGSSPMPKQEMDGMYGHGYTDLDGHMWELLYMEG